MAEKNSLPASLPGYGLLVVALAFLFGQAPGRKEAEKTIDSGQDPVAAVAATTPEAKPPLNPSDLSPSPPFPGHIRFLLNKRVFSLVGWIPVPRPNPGVRFLILTLPDPIDSQLGFWYDQCIDALNRAMADLSINSKEVYTLTDKWFPWVVATDDKGKPSGSRTGEPKTEPAVLVYQKTSNKQDRVVVLVVGETPTSGLRIEVLKAALGLAAIAPASPSGDQSIPLVGPSFSGSQATLARAVLEWSEGWSRRKEGATPPKIQCVSGTALGIKPWEEVLPDFAVRLNERFDPITGTQVPFEILHHEALRYLNRLGRTPHPAYEEGPLHLGGRMAYLVEANSGLGESAAATAATQDPRAGPVADPKSLVFRFPMHIGRLAGLLSKTDRERDERLGLIRPGEGLLSALDASRTGGDLIPAADETRTALLNQRLLADYWSAIRQEQVRYVWVVATDKRDTLFLLEQLQTACPRALPIVFWADLLLVHPDNLPYTRGVLVVGTYPLFHTAQRWQLSTQDHRRMPFPSGSAEGVYNAVLAVVSGKPDRMADYSPPPWFNTLGNHQPPIWLTTVGENGEFIPLACITNYEGDKKFQIASPDLDDQPTGPRSPFELPFLCLNVLITTIAVGGLWWVWRVDRQTRDAARVNPVVVPGMRAEYAGIAGIGAVFATLPVVLGFGSADLTRDIVGQIHCKIVEVIFLVLAVGTFWYVWRQVWWITTGIANGSGVPRGAILSHWQVLAFAILTAGLVFGWLLADHARLSEADLFLFAERASALSSGCSPVMPASVIALGLLGYGLLGLEQVQLMARFRIRRPYPIAGLVPSGVGPARGIVVDAVVRIRAAVREIDTRLGTLSGVFAAPGRLGWTHWLRLPIWATAGIFVVWVIQAAARTGAVHWLLSSLGLVVIAVTVVLVLFLLIFIWRHERRTPLACPRPASWLLLLTVAGACAVAFNRAQATWESRAWNCLFASGLLALAFMTLVAGYRLYLLWKQIEKITRAIAVIPMVGAFDRFPDKLSRVLGEYLLSHRKRSLDLAIPLQLLGRLRADLADDKSPEADRVREALAAARATPDGDSGEEMDGRQTDALCRTARLLVQVLAPGWEGLGIIEAFGKVPLKPDEDPPETKGWRDSAQQFVAVMAVIFLAQYFIRMRYLAYSVVATSGALLLAITSYQFEPERFLMYTAVGFAGAVIVLLLWILYRINRNELVSRVTRSTPNKFQLDSAFVQNVVVFVLPLATVVATQVAGRMRGIAEPILGLFR